MRTSARGIDLIKRHEGLRLKAYKCPAGVWTIGYGHTKDVRSGQVITTHQAEEILNSDLELEFEPIIAKAVSVELNQNQFDALVSFVFNVGPGKKGVKDGFVVLKNGQPSSMRRKLNAGDYTGAAAEFMSWKFAAGRVLPGLVKRRAEERTLFVGVV